MVGCAAYGCTNRSEKGFLMKKFPKDPVRRKIWASKVKRDGWTPANASVLCKAHFDETMWEKTHVDGSRKLKHDAVPTIFVFVSPRKTRKLPTKRILTTSEDIPIVSTHRDESLAQLQLEPIAGPSNVAVTNIENAHNADSPFVSLSSEEEECNELLLQTKDCNKAYKKVKCPNECPVIQKDLLYAQPLALKQLKYENVMLLADKYVPKADIAYYTSLVSDQTSGGHETDVTDDGDFSTSG
ncbi:THAP-type zinc finger [Holotrichia oblita]|uniref:THAP-type zinc finger n=1 Tax=Holotrichia oblita TaxID=644536 RepID=A0ACB9TZF5_HOLOL|nr:THAP-type zinc finger [Holotrichia oblita]